MKTRSEAGLTLTELIVVTGIMAMLSALVYGTFRYQTLTYSTQTTLNATQSSLRVWLGRMVKDVRRIGFDPLETGLFGVATYTSTEFTAYSDADSDGVRDTTMVENIGYKFEDGTLYVWQGGTSWRPVLTGVGGLAFTYRDVQGSVVDTVIEDIAVIEVSIAAQATTASYNGVAVETAPTPVFNVGTDRTTVTMPSDTGGAPMIAQVERAMIRNPR